MLCQRLRFRSSNICVSLSNTVRAPPSSASRKLSNRCLAAVCPNRLPLGKTVGCGGRRLAVFVHGGGWKIQSAQCGGPVRFRAVRPASAGGSKQGRAPLHRVGRPGGRFCIGRVHAGTSRSSSPCCRTDGAQSAAGCRLSAGRRPIECVSYGMRFAFEAGCKTMGVQAGCFRVIRPAPIRVCLCRSGIANRAVRNRLYK